MSKEIIAQIEGMLQGDCKGCKVKPFLRKEQSRYLAKEHCEKICPIGKKIKKLSLKLDMGLTPLVAQELTADQYTIHKEQGMTDKAICEKYGIGAKTLLTRKRHWGFGDGRANIGMINKHTKEEYLELKLKGLIDEEIAKQWGVVGKTLWRWKKRNNLAGGLEWIMKLDKQGRTKEEYLQLKVSGLNDSQIARQWGVKWDTLSSWKKSYDLRG